MTQDEQIAIYKERHDKLQEGLSTNQMAIREGIVLEVGTECYPRFGFEFFCFRNPSCVLEMDAFIKYAKGKKCLLDVGSFHGIFSVVFTEINKEGIAYAFEPFQEPFNVLMKTCEDNERVIMAKAALSDNSGTIKLFEYGGHLTSKQVAEDQKSDYCHAITGDAFCYGCYPNIIPDIIKIDTEGNELKVLRGLSNVIHTYHPVIFLELHYDSLSKEEILEIMEIIGWYNYTIVDIDSNLEMPLSGLLLNSGEKRILLT